MDRKLRTPIAARVPRGKGEAARFWLFAAFVLLCAFTGGSARIDVPGLLLLRPAAVLILGALLLWPGRVDYTCVRAPLLMLGVLALIMLAQLVPLPPFIWESLPGRDFIVSGLRDVGIAPAWRPLTLSPDRTLNALLALLPPLVALVAIAGMGAWGSARIVEVVLALALASALFGALQISGGAHSMLYFYRYTHDGLPVGLFANRNHEAAFLALSLPFLRIWAMRAGGRPDRKRFRAIVATLAAALLVLMILVCGSRAGFALMWVGLAGAWLIVPPRFKGQGARKRLLLGGAVGLGVGLLVATALFANRAFTLDRLAEAKIAEDGRFSYLPVIVRMVLDAAPTGFGFGTFDPVNRAYEPDNLLSAVYFNHAHNDLLEILMDGGIPAACLLAVFLGWLVMAATRFAHARKGDAEPRVIARACIIAVAIVLLASLVDYPLRTPLIATVFGAFCGIVAREWKIAKACSSRVALAS